MPNCWHNLFMLGVTAIVHRYSSVRERITWRYADRNNNAPADCGPPRLEETTSTKSEFSPKRGIRCCAQYDCVNLSVPKVLSLE